MTLATTDFHSECVSACLHIRVLSRYILEHKEETFVGFAAAIKDHSAKALFVDIREVPGPFKFMEYVGLGELTGRYLNKVPVAVLALEAQLDPDRIGKVVAQNRGANVETFTDQAEAQAWVQKYLTPQR